MSSIIYKINSSQRSSRGDPHQHRGIHLITTTSPGHPTCPWGIESAHPKFPTSHGGSTPLNKLPPEHHTPLTSHSSSRKGRLPLAPTSTTAVGPNRSRGKVERTHLTIEEM